MSIRGLGVFGLVAMVAAVSACGPDRNAPAECTYRIAKTSTPFVTVQTALIDARPGDVLCFEDGNYHFTEELSLTQDNVKIRGTFDKAVFDFADQEFGANGLLVTGDDFVIENIHLKNMAGDGLRVNNVTNVTIRNVKVSWDAGSVVENGDYALYPVGCTNVLITDSEVVGARDAGIYVGQSENIIVRDNYVHGNVAGIEIENSSYAEVVGNHSVDNTAGVLVFNLSNLPVKNGERTLVHDNLIERNNRPSFAAPGTIVGQVPHGIGVLVMASDYTEVTNNDVENNISTGVVVISRDTVDINFNDPDYDPYPETSWIHDNRYVNNGTEAQGIIGGIAAAIHGTLEMEDIVWDGTVDASKDNSDGSLSLCIQESDASFINIDYQNNFANWSNDVSPHDCTHDNLSPIDLEL